MQSFSRGWSFLVQVWQMAWKDKDLLKPSIYALLVGFVLSALGVIPVVGAYWLFGDSGMGRIFTFLLGALMVFLNFWKIAKENLLLMGISVVGVRSVTGLIGFVLGVGGALMGLVVGYGLVAAPLAVVLG